MNETIDTRVVEIEVAKLSLELGDILVFRVDDSVSAEQANNMANAVHRMLSGKGITPLVIRKSVDISVITPSQIAAALAARKVAAEPNGLEELAKKE